VASCAASEAAPIALRYARFADEQYQQTSQHVAEIDQLDSYSRRKQAEVHQLVKQSKTSQNHSSDLHSRHRVAVALSEQDRHTVDSFRESRTSLLQSALGMYGHALACTDNDEDSIFRLCSLWLENFDNDSIFDIARQSIEKIPSHRFVALVPQLSARLANLSDVETSFKTTLSILVERSPESILSMPYFSCSSFTTRAPG
jgi:ataxia telangiectasia mutated family protein